jgi:hypothetical protein
MQVDKAECEVSNGSIMYWPGEVARLSANCVHAGEHFAKAVRASASTASKFLFSRPSEKPEPANQRSLQRPLASSEFQKKLQAECPEKATFSVIIL